MTTTPDAVAAPVANFVDPVVMFADPYDTYRALHELGPVAWVPALNRYLATSYAACRAIEADQETYSASVSGSAALMARALGTQPMLRKDDPEHAVERRPINSPLRPKNIRETWVPGFRANAQMYLEQMISRGPDLADLNSDCAAPLGAKNLIDILGMKSAEPEDMRRWSHAFIDGFGNIGDDQAIWARCADANTEVDALLDSLIPHYASHPDTSMTSAWVNAGLPEVAVRANIKLAISGGMNEPQHMITNMVWALSQHPDQRELVLADPSLWSTTFDEAVRYLSPIGMYPRETTRPTVLEGVELPAKAAVGVVVGAANRDPSAFERPDEFDIARPKQPHLGFGSGTHLCAGHWAARISIGEIAVPLLYERLPGLRTDERRTEEWRGWIFRGLSSHPVTW